MALLTSGMIRQLGWVFVLFGAGFSAGFLPFVDLRWRGYDAVGEGEVVDVERTSATENDERIFKITVAHEAATPSRHERRRYLFRSYTVTPPEVGERVTVEYESADPAEARMRGARARPFGAWAALVVMIPLVGLLFALHRVREGARLIGLLRRGRPVRARLVAKGRGSDEINDVPESLMRFTFLDEEGGERRFEVRTFAPERLEDEATELAIYDPSRPALATAIDALPGRLELHDDRVVARGRLWHLQILPALSLLAIAAAALSRSLW
jgi:hypothetical protein